MLAVRRHTVVLVLGFVLFAVMLAACGGGPSDAEIEANYAAALSPVVSDMEQSLQIVQDNLEKIGDEVTLWANDEVSESHMRVLLADTSVVFIREGVVLETIIQKIGKISPPPKAERYHELLLEYARLRQDGTKLTAEATGKTDLEVWQDAVEIHIRADLKNKEAVEEGVRAGLDKIHVR